MSEHHHCEHNHQHHQHEHHHHEHHHHQHHHKLQGTDKKFQSIHPNYASMDSAPQTYFYTLTNMMKLNQAKNILEVGCGAGKLLSTILDLKNPDATYLATDVSQGMVTQAKKRLQAHFSKYESKLSFEEWLQKQHLALEVQNGQNIQPKDNIQFDRIIVNMVLCHANDPQKMLKNWNSVATDDCLLGISLLGDPQKNNFVRGVRQAIQEAGEKLPQGNPPYYWYDKISKIVQASGWQIVLEWQQNALFPFLSADQLGLKHMISKSVPEKAFSIFEKNVLNKYMKEEKSGVQCWAKLIIARKKTTK